MIAEDPLVSIVIPCYNHAQFVQETIQSVIDQSYRNIELIIIDDGSKDNSVEVIKKMQPACEKRFSRFEFRYRPNKGLCATLNEALKWCEGEFFAPIASDDTVRKYKTCIQVKYLQENASSIGVFGGVELIDEKVGTSKTIIKKARKYFFEDVFLHRHTLPASTQFLRLKSVKNAGGFREELAIEDWSMWLFLTEHGGTLDYIDKVLSAYRKHHGNFSSQFDKMQESRIEILRVFSAHPLYNMALSRVYMEEARDWQKNDFKKSLSSVKKSIYLDPKILLDIVFIKYIVKFIL